jgi:hypothetical protein
MLCALSIACVLGAVVVHVVVSGCVKVTFSIGLHMQHPQACWRAAMCWVTVTWHHVCTLFLKHMVWREGVAAGHMSSAAVLVCNVHVLAQGCILHLAGQCSPMLGLHWRQLSLRCRSQGSARKPTGLISRAEAVKVVHPALLQC